MALLNKRRFLVTTAAATAAACAWKPAFALGVGATPGQWRLSLNGPWRAAREGQGDWIAAAVPGCIHTDLLAAGKIPDPFYRDNERTLQWIGEANWTYRRTFNAPADILAHDHLLLRCEGLDTLATVKLNGREAGRADNMYRTWEFDAKPFLKPGENVIEITFASPLPYMKEKQAKRVLFEWLGWHETAGRAWVRKEPCNFGWDWGPVLITCGVWRNITLEAYDRPVLDDLVILQDHSQKGVVGLQVDVKTRFAGNARLKAAITVTHEGRGIGDKHVDLSNGAGSAAISINDAKLWWPSGMGAQPLYTIGVELLDAGGRVIDRGSRRIGLRTIKLVEKLGDAPMRFEVNGLSFFAKGANWIPADPFPNRVTPEILRRYMADAVDVNMNTLRFWGGGYYEEDALFDACDELGLCVWLDFKFACSSYPAFDDAFMENVRQEARDNLRRLRHHPCIAAWCGNNEISLMTKDDWSDSSMGRADYDKLFKNMLAREVKETAPQANYVSGSPDCGDIHSWAVWHGGKTFEEYRTLTGFMSEFGFQSFPEPKTVRAYTTEADRASLLTPILDWHQRSPNGNQKIRDMTLHYCRPPKDFDTALWLSQIVHAYGIKIGAEFWRQDMVKSTGCVFWQYNDCWPVTSWSSVDYFGKWKALHYFARRFYSPILVSGLENAAKGSIDVFVSSDRLEPCRGTLSWTVTDPAGKTLTTGSAPLDIPARASRNVKTLDLHELVQSRGPGNLLTWLKLVVDDQVVSDNLVTLALPKELKLEDPQIKASILKAPKGYQVILTAARPALWAWLSFDDLDARYSDNFVHLTPGGAAQILVTPAQPMSQAEFAKALRVRSLFDTYASTSA